jgi:predicted type IV restriction endonuclease
MERTIPKTIDQQKVRQRKTMPLQRVADFTRTEPERNNLAGLVSKRVLKVTKANSTSRTKKTELGTNQSSVLYTAFKSRTNCFKPT